MTAETIKKSPNAWSTQLKSVAGPNNAKQAIIVAQEMGIFKTTGLNLNNTLPQFE